MANGTGGPNGNLAPLPSQEQWEQFVREAMRAGSGSERTRWTPAAVLILPFAASAVDSADPTPWAIGGRAGRSLADVLNGVVTAMFLCALLAAGTVLLRFRRAEPVELNPARRRLQAAVDQQFDRARYDARHAVDAFAARLRDQVDQERVVGGLSETVTATVAPTRVGVWLNDPAGRRKV